jgi:RsiW-degrading membrane proteinase PrsW (M82 family)
MAAIMITGFSAVAWMTALLRLDPHRSRKRTDSSMMALFVLGALSAAPAYVLNGILPGDPFTGRPAAALLLFLFVYAPVEELSKLLVFSMVVARLRSLREPADGMYQAAAVGLGFAVVENVVYGAWFGPEVALIRATITPLRHMIYAATWGLAWSTQCFGRKSLTARGVLAVLLAVVPASMVHGFSNFLATIGFGPQLLFGAAMTAAAAAMLVRLRRHSPYTVGDLRAPGRALRSIQSALVHDPYNRHLHLRAAHFRIRGGDPAKAVEHLERFLAVKPNDSYAVGLMGAALVLSGVQGPGEEALEWSRAAMPAQTRRIFQRNLKRLLDPGACPPVTGHAAPGPLLGKSYLRTSLLLSALGEKGGPA